jgi:hypothetical protein
MDGAGADQAVALGILKPGYDPIWFGPLTRAVADDWATWLRAKALSQAPEATIDVIPYDPDDSYADPGAIPRTVDELVDQLRADPGHPANGGFPDLYDRLALVHGEARAVEMWQQASRQADAEAAYDEAVRAAAADRGEARRLLGEAHTLAEQAGDKVRRFLDAVGSWELDAIDGRSAGDVRAHTEAAARELRAALRAIGE